MSLLKGAKALIGNSSGGIIEAPYFNVPFILIGDRQSGREFGRNVIQVDSVSNNNILKALKTSESEDFYKNMDKDVNIFGDGNASKKIYKAIKSIDLNDSLFQKRIVY